jgi:hypothetical protein
MAKGSRDIILRDRLEFTTTAATGNTALVYGRVDLSDYVSIVKNEGLSIKEVRFQFRVPGDDEEFPIWLNQENLGLIPANTAQQSDVTAFATTTAYENAADVGIASPNVLCMYSHQSTVTATGNFDYRVTGYGTPDLHPEGYDVVTDLLIGVFANNLQNSRLVDATLELDVMIIAEPKKITQKDLTQMLTQAQDL